MIFEERTNFFHVKQAGRGNRCAFWNRNTGSKLGKKIPILK